MILEKKDKIKFVWVLYNFQYLFSPDFKRVLKISHPIQLSITFRKISHSPSEHVVVEDGKGIAPISGNCRLESVPFLVLVISVTKMRHILPGDHQKPFGMELAKLLKRILDFAIHLVQLFNGLRAIGCSIVSSVLVVEYLTSSGCINVGPTWNKII